MHTLLLPWARFHRVGPLRSANRASRAESGRSGQPKSSQPGRAEALLAARSRQPGRARALWAARSRQPGRARSFEGPDRGSQVDASGPARAQLDKPGWVISLMIKQNSIIFVVGKVAFTTKYFSVSFHTLQNSIIYRLYIKFKCIIIIIIMTF